MFKTNEYFDGKVKSIAFQSATLPATVGVMAPGDYVFNTAAKELMQVVSGELLVVLPGETEATAYPSGSEFNVPADSTFKVTVTVDTAYLCYYG